jgi:hypothetical protein
MKTARNILLPKLSITWLAFRMISPVGNSCFDCLRLFQSSAFREPTRRSSVPNFAVMVSGICLFSIA